MITANIDSSIPLVNGCHLGIFQSCGKVPLLNLFKIMDNGIAINLPTDFTIEIGQPSGPGGLLL